MAVVEAFAGVLFHPPAKFAHGDDRNMRHGSAHVLDKGRDAVAKLLEMVAQIAVVRPGGLVRIPVAEVDTGDVQAEVRLNEQRGLF
jgi:ribosomal protein L17